MTEISSLDEGGAQNSSDAAEDKPTGIDEGDTLCDDIIDFSDLELMADIEEARGAGARGWLSAFESAKVEHIFQCKQTAKKVQVLITILTVLAPPSCVRPPPGLFA